MNKKLIFSIVLAAFLLFGLQSAFAQLTTAIKASPGEANFTANYWTVEKMRSAKPVPFYKGNENNDRLFSNDTLPGPAGSVAGGLPGDNREKPIIYEDTVSDSGIGYAEEFGFMEDFGTQNIFEDTYINEQTPLWKQYPYKAIGRLFMTFGTSNASCSASVVSPNQIIVTAAHCCYDRGTRRWGTNFNFVPAYRNGNAPYGTYGWTRARVLTAWINSGGRQNDVCLIRLNRTVTNSTGFLGRSWNQPIVQHHHAYGYPSNIGSSRYLFEVTAESYANCGSPLVYGMGSSMTYGSSGGPWIRGHEHFKSGAHNYVNAVVSGWDGSCTGTFGQSFNGPRFTSNNIVALCNAEGC